MLNKKRLAMIAVAASMVLPTNLTYLSVATPVTVFAAEATTIASDTDLTSNTEEGNTLDVGYGKTYSTATVKFTGTDYKVTGDVTLSKTVYIEDEVNIEIASGATLNIPLQYGFLIGAGGTLNITGEGTINGKSCTPASGICEMLRLNGEGATLNIGSKLTFTQETNDSPFTYGVVLGHTAKGSTVTIGEEDTTKGNGTTFTLDSALSIHGAIGVDETTTVTLNGATITTPDVGIYQAGYSTLNVNDCTITSSGYSGIETRDGKLNVTGGTIKGGSTLESKTSGNGTSTKGAGIAIAQHKVSETNTRDIEVTIDDAELDGAASLLIVDPQENLKDSQEEANIEITVSNSQLKAPVAYTSDLIKFTLEETSYPSITKYTNTVASGTLTEDTGDIDPDTIPYTIINTTISKDVIENIAGTEEKVAVTLDGADETLKSILSDLPVSTLTGTDGLTKDNLEAALTAKSTTEITPAVGDPVAPNYTYEIKGFKGFQIDADNGISLVANEDSDIEIAVKLDSNSNIKLTTGEEETPSQGNEDDPNPANPGDEEGDTPEDLAGSEEDKVEVAPLTDVVEVMEDEALAGDEGETPAEDDEADGNEEAKDVTKYVPLNALEDTEGAATEGAINAYLADQPDLEGYVVDASSLPDGGLKENTPLTIGEDKDVELDDDGFIVVKLTKENSGDDEGQGGTTITPGRPGSTSKPKPKPEEPAEPTTPATPTTMYRLYNRLTSEHLFTTDKNERDNLLTSDTWKDEGEGWTAPSVSDYPVYRLLNPNTSDHHYTTDKNEFDTLPSYGWVAEGIAFFSADKDNPENVILHRLYNPNAQGAGMHHYTADTNERDTLVAQGWKYEGTAWAGLKN